ncbi:MAG: TIM barrel protein [Thermoflavifilum sp.]|nr:TIM barrel protein [Thermoflavifilum sp.]
MRIKTQDLQTINELHLNAHRRAFARLSEQLQEAGIDPQSLIHSLHQLQIAIPSWALGTGGTRFGRFPIGGEPRNLAEKVEDVGLLHALNRASGAISLHIPWDIPEDAAHIQALASELGLRFDAVNSNTFQDQPNQPYSYKFGSLCHTDAAVRRRAIEHNIEVIHYGEALGSKCLSIWLADGSNFPGQRNFQQAFQHTLSSLQEIYAALPADWTMLIEYKPYEPNFYATVIQDWGTAYLLCQKLGKQAFVLVDLGHHLPNTNIEQIVATLMMEDMLGGFHFNDSKYGDDDLTVGSIKPYQLFLIFHELVGGLAARQRPVNTLAWMIDASHNVKDPLEDLLQSVEAIQLAFAQALIVNRQALLEAQQQNDVAWCQELMQQAFRTDLRSLLAEARLQAGGALYPLQAYRQLQIRHHLIQQRGRKAVATGL